MTRLSGAEAEARLRALFGTDRPVAITVQEPQPVWLLTWESARLHLRMLRRYGLRGYRRLRAQQREEARVWSQPMSHAYVEGPDDGWQLWVLVYRATDGSAAARSIEFWMRHRHTEPPHQPSLVGVTLRRRAIWRRAIWRRAIWRRAT